MFSKINPPLDNEDSTYDTYLLMDELHPETIKPVIEWILANNNTEEPVDYLNLIICSPGGEVGASFALIDIMNASAIPIVTVGIGDLMSSAVTILMSGAVGLRFITENTHIMSHQFSSGGEGKHYELAVHMKGFNMISERLVKHYSKCTGLNEKKVRKVLLSEYDKYLTPKEAVEYGIADAIVTLD